MIRVASLDDVARAAALRQRAWPDSIITAEGMQHWLEATPERAERRLLAFDEAGELVGWASAGREWSRSDPTHGYVEISVDPAHRGRRIASRLMDEVDAHLSQLGVTTTRGESLDEPAARALAERRGFTESGSSSTSGGGPPQRPAAAASARRRRRPVRRARRPGAGVGARSRSLAVNAKLGYRPFSRRIAWERSVTSGQ